MVNKVQSRVFSRVSRRFYKGSDSSTVINAGSIQWTDTKSGSQNPQWRDLVAQHKNATTGFSGTRFEIAGHTSGLAEVRWTDPTVSTGIITDRIVGDILDVSDLPVLSPFSDVNLRSIVINTALSDFYKHCWGAIRAFEGGVFLGEIKEALDMIKHPAKALRRSVDNFVRDARKRTEVFRKVNRRIDLNSNKALHKVLSDTWLEHSFGWLPFMGDIEDGFKALRRLSKDPNEYARVSSFSARQLETTPLGWLSYNKTLITFLIRYRVNSREQCESMCRFLGEVRVGISNPYVSAAEQFGFVPENFAPTVWELIPYSFLVDYFTNIGDIISAWSFPIGRLGWFCRTIRDTRESNMLAYMVPASSPGPNAKIVSYSGATLHVYRKRSAVERSGESNALALPDIHLTIPGASLKWVNIAALAHLRFL